MSWTTEEEIKREEIIKGEFYKVAKSRGKQKNFVKALCLYNDYRTT